MNVQTHSPEPWDEDFIRPACEHCNGSHDSFKAEAEANIARAFACVNYCAGVPAERLTEDSLEIKLEHIGRLTAERDELMEAAAFALEDAEVESREQFSDGGPEGEPNSYVISSTAFDALRAAIAKAGTRS